MKDQSAIHLEGNSVLAVVGPNNSGKTHFLKSLRSALHGAEIEEVAPSEGPIEKVEVAWRSDAQKAGTTVWERVKQSFKPATQGYMVQNASRYPGMLTVDEPKCHDWVLSQTILGPFTELFLEFDDALDRIKEAELQPQVAPSPRGPSSTPSLTQLVHESPEVYGKVVSYFERIFHRDISFYERGQGNIGFLLAPELKSGSTFGSALSFETKNYMDSQPKLWLQGLGMRSVLGLLLKVFAGQKEIIIIDEPEAFLHPPQATALGTVLSEIAELHHKQIVLATHDRNLLNGLTKGTGENVSIQRVSRKGKETKIQGIPAEALSNVRDKSLIRYSPLLDSLFTDLTVLVENEKDAFFYSEAIQFLIEKNPETYRYISIDEILFLSTSGKGALGRTAELISSLHSRVVVACDFDLLADDRHLEHVTRGLTGQAIPASVSEAYEDLISVMFEKKDPSQQEKDRKFKKAKGNNGPDEEYNQLAGALIDRLDSLGIFLNHLGELEDFDRALSAAVGKSEWAHEAIVNKVHQRDDAQFFAQRVLTSLFGEEDSLPSQ